MNLDKEKAHKHFSLNFFKNFYFNYIITIFGRIQKTIKLSLSKIILKNYLNIQEISPIILNFILFLIIIS